MNLLVLRYHRARAGQQGNSARLLNAHFAHIAYACANRLPGEPLAPGMLNVCLTFDAGFRDFYAVVYRLLIQHDLRAVLAVAPSCSGEYDAHQPADRLAFEPDGGLAACDDAGFCTWSELDEMVSSGRVTIAARSAGMGCDRDRHARVQTDVIAAQTILSRRFARPVESFVLADGERSPSIVRAARQRYRFVFGSGDAANRDWHQPMLYRITADELSSPTAPFSARQLIRYRARYWWKQLREGNWMSGAPRADDPWHPVPGANGSRL
jgi:hypothetical protein